MLPAYPQRTHDPGFNHDHRGALTGMAKMEMDAIDASFVVGLASVFMIVGHTRTKTAKSIRRVASSAINKPSRSDPRIARLLESEGGKDEFAEAGDYKELTDTAETYPEHEASEFAIVMEDDEDGDDAVDADDLKRREAIDNAIRAVKRHGMTYADAGDLVGYSAAWVSDRIAEYRDGDHGGSVNELEA